MSVQRAQQAQASLGQSALVMITARGDDVALRIGQMVKRGLPEVWERPSPRHWTQRGRRWGWTAVIWRASIVTEGAHRQGAVETDLQGMQPTLSPLTAQGVKPLDCSDDRLRHLWQHVSQPTYGPRSERAWHARSLEVYALPQDVIRWDATTVSGAHEVPAEGLGQFGQRKEDPTRPQSKVMLGSLAPWGMPLSTDVWAGERADDGFYRPIIERIRTGWKTPGLLCVGAGKMRALATRASLARPQDWYVSPWPWTGATAEAMAAWSTVGVTQRAAGE